MARWRRGDAGVAAYRHRELASHSSVIAGHGGDSPDTGRLDGIDLQNMDPPTRCPNCTRWCNGCPTRRSHFGDPRAREGGQYVAVESFTDEIAATTRVDPVEFRLEPLTNPRGTEVLRRVASRMGWQPRPLRGQSTGPRRAHGAWHRLRALQTRGDVGSHGHGGGGGARHRPRQGHASRVRPGLGS